MRDARSERGFAIAAVIQAIPPAFSYFVVGWLSLFMLIALGLNFSQLPAFFAHVLFWCQVVLIVAGVSALILFGIWMHSIYHDVVMKHNERVGARAKNLKLSLQNEMLTTKIQMEKQLPLVMKYAMDQGKNIEYGGLKVSHYLSNVHMLPNAGQGQLPPASVPEYLPEPYKMSDVLKNWTPTKDGILLGKKEDLILCPAGENLCHTVFTGNTDAGKTNDSRMLLIQLLYLQQICYICDRNYQTYRQDKKLGIVYDYRPIENLLAHDPIDTSAGTLRLLQYLVGELDDRRARRRKAIVHFKDIYLFIDELPALCAEEPEIMAYVGRIVREARQYGIFFVGAAQDILNKTLNNDNGAIRDNLLTNFYGGGDFTTAKITLNLDNGEKIDESGLGKMGAKYIRAKGAGIEKIKARTPLADDLATQMLLGDRVPVTKVEIPLVSSGSQTEQKDLPSVIIPVNRRRAEDVDLAEAIAFNNARGGASVRDFERSFDLTNHQAQKLWKMVRNQSINQTAQGGSK